MGRPKKNKGFKGTPNKKRKCDEQNVDLVIERMRDRSKPLGLVNAEENVCFFNSVIQLLFSVESFREHIYHLEANDMAALSIKNLFREMEFSSNHVKTSLYIDNLQLGDYVFGQQYDAQECLLQVLNHIFSCTT